MKFQIDMQQPAYINKYLPIAFLYFFLNSLFLPLGLLYTTLLTPFFLYWILTAGSLRALWIFLLISLVFAWIHIANGVDMASYVKSFAILTSAVIFGISFNLYVRRSHNLAFIYKNILFWNFLLTLLALCFLYIPSLQGIFWYNKIITAGTPSIRRLKMFTYEPSYYSLLLAPIAIYYYLKLLLTTFSSRWQAFWMVSVPLALAFSLGVLFAAFLAILFVFLSDTRLFFIRKNTIRNILLILVLSAFVLLLLGRYYPDNILFIRISNIFHGGDSSFKGRTADSFYLAWAIAAKKSILFGCGPGQIKIIGANIFAAFYKNVFTAANTAIPNAMAETLAIYGLFGFLLKVGLESFLFFRCRVYRNYYQLGLFVFIFIYQFTGSFITNIAEYVTWILAFTPAFEEFNKNNFSFKEKKI